SRLGQLAAENGVDVFCGGSQRGLLRTLFESFMHTRNQMTEASRKAILTAFPYSAYYRSEEDDLYDMTHVQNSLKDQQQALAKAGSHLIALPGGIGTRGEIWNTIEELRCNPSYTDKHLWLLNIDRAYDGLRADIQGTLCDGTT